MTSTVSARNLTTAALQGIAILSGAWRQAKPGSQPERVLFVLWVVTLAVLVLVMAPAIFANTTGLQFASLPSMLLVAWSIAVASSTFLVIGGVGYAERAPMRADAPVMRTDAPHDARIAPADAVQSKVVCAQCGAECKSTQALAAHIRWQHANVSVNQS